jgi:hypothetical protein
VAERPYDKYVETVIAALVWREGPMFDANLFGDSYNGPEEPQIDRAEAIAMWGKGLTVDQLGLKVDDMGVDDPCLILEGVLKSDRVETGLRSPIRGAARRGNGFIVFLIGEDPVRGYQVLTRLLPPGDRLGAQLQPAPDDLVEVENRTAVKLAAAVLKEKPERSQRVLRELLFNTDMNKRHIVARDTQWLTDWGASGSRFKEKCWKAALEEAGQESPRKRGRRTKRVKSAL